MDLFSLYSIVKMSLNTKLDYCERKYNFKFFYSVWQQTGTKEVPTESSNLNYCFLGVRM